MHDDIHRFLKLFFIKNPRSRSAAAFLWGARQTGKTTLLHQRFPKAVFYDLLNTKVSAELSIHPHTLREEVLAARPSIVVIDEIQKNPQLIDEVHWLLENTATQFILCGSSARKLKRKAHNLLGGRAIEFQLFPLTSQEIPDFHLDKLLRDGGLPTHYLLKNPKPLLKAYVNNYIKEEIIDESLTRNIPAFSRFLHTVALTHGQQLNYANIARESGVSANTVRSYFEILKDTLIGFELPPWRRSQKRRMIETAKFYLFDIGVANYLHPDFVDLVPGTDLYGRAFEHFLINEVRAYLCYQQLDMPLSYWRTSSGFEVDLILGNMQIALEFKSATQIRSNDLKSLRALKEEHKLKRTLVVCRSETLRKTEDAIEIMPWQQFCKQLWDGKIF